MGIARDKRQGCENLASLLFVAIVITKCYF
jgi:hypothetical protein